MGFLDQRILVGIEGYLNDEAAQEEWEESGADTLSEKKKERKRERRRDVKWGDEERFIRQFF